MHAEDYNSPTISHQCNLCMWLSFILWMSMNVYCSQQKPVSKRESNELVSKLLTMILFNWKFTNNAPHHSTQSKTTANIYFIHIIIEWMWSWDDDQQDSFAYHLTNSIIWNRPYALALFLNSASKHISFIIFCHFQIPLDSFTILSGAFLSFFCFHVFSSQAIL